MHNLTVIVITALSLVSADSALAQQERIESVDPRVYLQTRAHQPNAVRELSTKLDTAVVILRDGISDAMLAPREAYPQGAKDADVAAMRELERRALAMGAVHAVAKHKPAGALALLEKASTHVDARVRAEAAQQLGALGDAALPAIVKAAGDDDGGVREAAMIGLGNVRTMKALDVLAPFARDLTDVRRQSAAIRAAGAMTSKWAWQARNDARGAAAMRAAVTSLLASIERSDGNAAALDHVHKVWLR
jgi:HEAT repeat protein